MMYRESNEREKGTEKNREGEAEAEARYIFASLNLGEAEEKLEKPTRSTKIGCRRKSALSDLGR